MDFLAAISAFLAAYVFVAWPVVISGSSMEPNYKPGAYYMVEKISSEAKYPSRGTVVIYSPFSTSGESYIARTIGLPGDVFEIKDSTVYINGEKLPEPYLTEGEKTLTAGGQENGDPITIPKDFYLLLGDNRDMSADSRVRGYVSRKNIEGKVWFCYANCDGKK